MCLRWSNEGESSRLSLERQDELDYVGPTAHSKDSGFYFNGKPLESFEHGHDMV